MYFYIDESGHTGTNLFDENQPYLYYGTLSSKLNLDVFAEPKIAAIRKKCGVDRIHASELGVGRLSDVVIDLEKIRRRFDLRFGLNRIAKRDHAIISFYDQIFDQGINPAMTWTSYWTPLRYVILSKLSFLFDLELTKLAWASRIELNQKKSNEGLQIVIDQLLKRLVAIPDQRSRELIGDGLKWASENIDAIQYNVKSKDQIFQISPNLIGFQSALHGISALTKKMNRKPTNIVVDRQSQFNKAQRELHDIFKLLSDKPHKMGFGLVDADFTGTQMNALAFTPGNQSTGLELVDIYLWVFKRKLENKPLSNEIEYLSLKQAPKCMYEEVSIKSIEKRWSEWFANMPEPDADSFDRGQELLKFDENRRWKSNNDA